MLALLTTREPVLRAVVPFQSWQLLRSEEVAEVVRVRLRGIDERRTFSPDCDASSCTVAERILLPPATIDCDVGVVPFATLSVAALIVIVFIVKFVTPMTMLLPVVLPVTLPQSEDEGLVEAWIVTLLMPDWVAT
jgi:hypothetical protein